MSKNTRSLTRRNIPDFKKIFSIWQVVGIIMLVVGFALIWFLVPPNIFKLHAVINYIILTGILIYGWATKGFRTREANKFALFTLKGIDKYAHFWGALAFTLAVYGYLIEIIPFGLLTEETVILYVFVIVFMGGFVVELSEFIVEKILTRNKPKTQKAKIDISEPRGNVIQDIIVNTLGTLAGMLYVFILTLTL